MIADQQFRICFSIIGIVALRDHWALESDDEVLLRIDAFAKSQGKGKLDFKLVRDLIWAGLQEYHPEITPDQAMKLVSQAGLNGVPALLEAILSTLAASAPPQGAGGRTRPLKATRANGKLASTN